MLIKSVELNCEGFDYFRPRSNISRVIDTKYLSDNDGVLYQCITVDNKEVFIHETSKMYDSDDYVTTLDIYDSEQDVKRFIGL